MVERAARRVPTAVVRVGSAESLPFDDQQFTVVVNVASFHHWIDRDAGLREVLRVLGPGGRVHIMEGVIGPGQEGHGLTAGEVESLTARFLELGYVEASADTVRIGRRHRYYVVTAIAP
jgi:ubiquinone/menaquinone biosynthesis C-methylase UbiE